MRTFISINLDDAAKAKISAIQAELKNEISAINKSFLNSVKWTEKNNFHLTLFFIGDTDKSKLDKIDNCLKKLEEEISSGEIIFDAKKLNAFPKLRYPRVLILELTNNDNKVFELSGKIFESMKCIGIESDKQFHPHITLGRVRRENKINLSGLEDKVIMDFSFSVNEFYLMESKLNSGGSEYSEIKKYLTGKKPVR